MNTQAWPNPPNPFPLDDFRAQGALSVSDNFFKLFRIIRQLNGELERDLFLADQVRERLVKRLHAELAAGLHQHRNLFHLVLANEVFDGWRDDEDLRRQHAARAGDMRYEVLR